jgi:hypothetical protein
VIRDFLMPRQASLPVPDQPDMFGAAPAPAWQPNPDKVRARLVKLLAEARAARPAQWDPSTLSLYRTIFPQMAQFLGAEGAGLLRQFETELARLDPA